jgi:hypothetical protein
MEPEAKKPGLDDYLFRFLEQLDAPKAQANANSLSGLERGRVSDAERVIQLATKLAREHHFQDGIEVLIGALEISRHGKTISALKELLKMGITREKMKLVLELRSNWREYPEFSAFVGGPLSFGNARREILSYRLAFKIIRYFPYQVEIEEIISLLFDLLFLWRDRQDLVRRYPAFQDFVAYAVAYGHKLPSDELDHLNAWRAEL